MPSMKIVEILKKNLSTKILLTNFEILAKKSLLQKVQKNLPKMAEGKKFSFQILNPLVLRNTCQGEDH